MDSKALGWLRLTVAIPAALLVYLAAQSGLAYLIYSVGGVAFGRGEEFGPWLVKVLVSPFMAATFFWTLYLVAPRQSRPPVAVGALVAIGVWGTLMMAGAVTPWPRFQGWLFAMGLAGWLGGAISYLMTRRGRRVALGSA